jgi:hypothetical protein
VEIESGGPIFDTILYWYQAATSPAALIGVGLALLMATVSSLASVFRKKQE